MGFIIPLFFFGMIMLINYILVQTGILQITLDRKIHLLISLSANLFSIRYYFVSLKYDKTGRGLLLVTFILMILFFVFKDKVL